MERDRWPDVERLFLTATALPPAEREAYLAAACRDDGALRDEVQSLLDAEPEAEAYFEAPSGAHTLVIGAQTLVLGALSATDGPPTPPEDLAPGTRLGPWTVDDEVGRGGMGTVYRARRADGAFQQTAALKLVRRGMDTAAIVGRFLRERAVLAGLDHPAIARLLDGGEATDGRPYVVMEFVEGEPITTAADRRRLRVDERLALFLQVCDAVAHAHRRLVVHRDLKPANILVGEGEHGAPTVKLLDFGIAKLLDDPDDGVATLTGDGARLLTPEYAAPEQLDGGPITTATDVYALGVLLYELLAGQRPHPTTGRSTAALAHAIRTGAPPRPSTSAAPTRTRGAEATETAAGSRATTPDGLRHALQGDLDAICLKALRPEPEARYASVDDLAADVRAYLDGRPVAARQGTTRYVAGKFVRRHRWPVAAATALVVLLVGFAAFATVQNRRIARERDRAEAEARESDAVAGFLRDLLAASDPREGAGGAATVREVLDGGARRIGVELAGQPEVQARMQSVVGSVYTAIGRYDESRRLLEAAWARQRRLVGRDHPDALATQEALAELAWESARYGRADTLYRDALRRRLRTEPGGLPVARTLLSLGELYSEMGRFAEAAQYLRQSLARFRRAGADGAVGVADVQTLLGVMAGYEDHFDRADTLLTAALRAQRAWLGPRHPTVGQTLVYLSELRREQGRPRDAERLARQAIPIFSHAYGPRHPRTASAWTAVAGALLLQNRPAEAERILQATVAIERATFGEPRHQLAVRTNQLAYAAYLEGDTTATIRLLREALGYVRGIPDWRNPTTGTISWNLATTLEETGDLTGAAAAYRDALDIYTQALGADHADAVLTRQVLGRALADIEACPSALPHLRATLPPLANPGDGYDATARSGYGHCLAEAGAYAEAERQLRSAVAVLRADPAWGAEDRRTQQALDRLAALYDAWGRPADAARVRRERAASRPTADGRPQTADG